MRHTFTPLAFGIVLICALHTIGIAADVNSHLLDAVRNDDTRAARSLIASGADAHAGDDIGATALMHAAGFASVDTMRLLLEAGADVNASSRTGAPALMWATADTSKVRLLLDRGAAVDAITKDGTTALVTAAGEPWKR